MRYADQQFEKLKRKGIFVATSGFIGWIFLMGWVLSVYDALSFDVPEKKRPKRPVVQRYEIIQIQKEAPLTKKINTSNNAQKKASKTSKISVFSDNKSTKLVINNTKSQHTDSTQRKINHTEDKTKLLTINTAQQNILTHVDSITFNSGLLDDNAKFWGCQNTFDYSLKICNSLRFANELNRYLKIPTEQKPKTRLLSQLQINISEAGKITQIIILRSTGDKLIDQLLAEANLKMTKVAFPKIIPARKNGKNTAQQLLIPIIIEESPPLK